MLEKAKTIKIGIDQAKVLFFSINIFFTAGSNNQAIPDVLPATIIDKIKAKKIFLNVFLHILYKVFLKYFKFFKFHFINLLKKYLKIKIIQKNYLI